MNSTKGNNIEEKRANELINLFWFNTHMAAKHCAIYHCEKMIEELNHHSDLHGYYQDENGHQSIIEFYKKVITILRGK